MLPSIPPPPASKRQPMTDIAAEYEQQLGWRSWPRILDALPAISGQKILDLGCGVGDLSALLAARGARVLGLDANDDLLRAARSKGLENAEFRHADLSQLPAAETLFDGLWGSFVAAYFTDLSRVLQSWGEHLRPGGWIALTEIDDLFGHLPVSERTRELLDAYVRQSLAAGRYDFRMGRRLTSHLERAGFTVSRSWTVEDREFAFSGPAAPGVISAWGQRFDRMRLLQDFCGSEFAAVRRDFLEALARSDHRSEAKVYCCLATKPGAG